MLLLHDPSLSRMVNTAYASHPFFLLLSLPHSFLPSRLREDVNICNTDWEESRDRGIAQRDFQILNFVSSIWSHRSSGSIGHLVQIVPQVLSVK